MVWGMIAGGAWGASAPMALPISCLGGYLLGSIPFGVIATRLGGAGDVRRIGSGNIGATNVLRTGRRDLALITLIGDAGKGAAAVLLANYWLGDRWSVVAGAAAFLGHLFPIWLRFRGGKGVATFFGVLLAAAPAAGVAAAAAWLAVFALGRISSVAALAAAALSPVFVYGFAETAHERLWLAVGMMLLIVLRHRQNIARLLAGAEPRSGAPAAPPPPP